MNFGESRSSKTAAFAILGALNFVNLVNSHSVAAFGGFTTNNGQKIQTISLNTNPDIFGQGDIFGHRDTRD